MERTHVHLILLGIVGLHAINFCFCTNHPSVCSQPYKGPPCDSQARYRTMDGTCNNLANPTWGAAMTPQLRLLPPVYTGGIDAPRQYGADGQLLPNPRDISNGVFKAISDGPINDRLTMVVMQWGQVSDHDMTKTLKAGIFDCCTEAEKCNPECFPIDIPKNDCHFMTTGQTCMNFERSKKAPTDGCPVPVRQQINAITAYIDASFVYGSSNEKMNELREKHGLLKSKPHRLLPEDHMPEECILSHPHISWCPLTGDARAPEVPTLTAIHTAFFREHNRIAQILRDMNHDYWDEETVFQETRKLIGAIVQHITYNEYLPAILNEATMTRYKLRSSVQSLYNDVYNPELHAGILNAFSSAAYRFGHSLVRNYQSLVNKMQEITDQIPIEQTFKDPYLTQKENGANLDALFRWVSSQPVPLVDSNIVDGVRNLLFPNKNGHTLDLTALNIQRGRDHGLPSYNYYRMYCNLDYASDFELDFIPDHTPETTAQLKSLYRSVWDVDLFVGGMSEEIPANSSIGPLFACILGTQFYKLKIGDRFWYETSAPKLRFTPGQLRELKKVTFASILCLNFDIDKIQPNVFLTSNDSDNQRIHCNGIYKINLIPWKAKRTRTQ